MKMPRSLVRLVPSVIAVLVTVSLIAMLGRDRYGEVSILLATGSLLNCMLFHCSRNLIVFRSLLGLCEGELSDSWMVAILLSPFILALMWIGGSLSAISAVLVGAYLTSQSLFEREIEYLRSSMDLPGFLMVACARPLWSLLGIGLCWFLRSASWLPLALFSVISISPVFACLPRMNEVAARLRWQGWGAIRSAAKIIPLGMVITLSVSYIFVSDALIKLVLNKWMARPAFGLYASGVDLIMPACWILTGAFTWDFVPRVLRLDPDKRWVAILEACKRMAVVLVIVTIAMVVTPDVRMFGVDLHLRLYSSMVAANLFAATLSCLLFPALIVVGRKYLALAGSIFGVALSLSMLALFRAWRHEEDMDALTMSHVIVVAQGVVMLVAAGMLRAVFGCTRLAPATARKFHGLLEK